MSIEQAIEAVEQRAFDARVTLSTVCERAGIFPQVWSRAKRDKRASVSTLKRMEDALSTIEAERAA